MPFGLKESKASSTKIKIRSGTKWIGLDLQVWRVWLAHKRTMQLLILNTAASKKPGRSCSQLEWRSPRVAKRQYGRWRVMAAGAADPARRDKWKLVAVAQRRTVMIFFLIGWMEMHEDSKPNHQSFWGFVLCVFTFSAFYWLMFRKARLYFTGLPFTARGLLFVNVEHV